MLLAIVAGTTDLMADGGIQIGDLYYWLDPENHTATVTYKSYDQFSNEINKDWNITSANIPASITYNTQEYSVTSIGNGAFVNCTSLISITIPNSVTSIGYSAFCACNSLTFIDIPNSVTSIEAFTFSGCKNLNSVTIGNSVTSIGEYAFYDCSSLTSVTIGNSVTSIGEYAFYCCNSLTVVTIGNKVTNFGYLVFKGCSSLTSVVWNAKRCDDFISHDSPFIDICSQITSLTFGDEVEYIPAYLCSRLNNLTSVTIPNSVTSIGYGAFSGCSSLAYITIGNGLRNVNNDAFQNCSIKHIRFTGTMYEWCTKSFSPAYISSSYTLHINDESVTNAVIPNSITNIKNSAFSGCSSLTSVTIGNNVTSIGAYAFSGCSSLTSVTIFSSLTNIGKETFSGCNTQAIRFKGTMEEWLSKSWNPGDVSSSYKLYIDDDLITDVTFPNNVTVIGNNAFNGCGSLKNVVLGSSVKVLESGAFSGCTAIETITCYSMRPPTVEENAFSKLPYSTIVYVQADYLSNYTMHDFWGMYDVRPIGTASVETEDVQVTPTETTADIAWPTVTGAASYELVIRDQNGDIICTLVFNSKGQLTSITFNAPGRDNAPDNVQTAGFSFTVSGLDAGTTYNYTLTAKDSGGNILDTRTGSFKTAGTATAVDEMEDIPAAQPRKVMRDGVMYILMPDGRMYDVKGAEVK